MKRILDVCCGCKQFWFDKNHPLVIYADRRKEAAGFQRHRPNKNVNPDIVADFRNLPFPDKTFKLVVMDPPHIISKSDSSILTKEYGFLDKDTWRTDIKKGFDECMRVLDDFGVLVFKWSEISIKRKDILDVLVQQPLFGHPVGSKVSTHWFVFMKEKTGENK